MIVDNVDNMVDITDDMPTCCGSPSVKGSRVDTWNMISRPLYVVNTDSSPVWFCVVSKPARYLKQTKI